MLSLTTVIPCHNSDPAYLGEAVRSLEAQSSRPDEVLLVDDGSEHEVELPPSGLPLRRIRRPHGGIGAARNAGIDEARGDVIHVLDDDDLLEPELYARLLARIERGADVAFCTVRYIDADGRPLPGQFPPAAFTGSDDWLAALVQENRIGSVGAVFRRELWSRVGGFTAHRTSSDWRFWIDAAREGARIDFLPEPLALHRRRSGQITDAAHLLDIRLEYSAMLREARVPLRLRWRRSYAVARWRIDAARLAHGRQRALLLARAGLRRPRTALAVGRGR